MWYYEESTLKIRRQMILIDDLKVEKMMSIKRKVLKICLMTAKYMHGKKYMEFYNRYLIACGMDIQGRIKYIHSSVYLYTAYASHIQIGDNCVISVNTIVLAHDYSIECGMTAIGLGDLRNEKKIVQQVYIGNNVFVGAGCVILPGTRIGDNCIIGAGTVCSGNIPENSIVVGEKCRVIAKTAEWTEEKIKQYNGIFVK